MHFKGRGAIFKSKGAYEQKVPAELIFRKVTKAINKLVGDHPFCFKEVGRAGGVFFWRGGGAGMNVVVKTKISYILEHVYN